MDNSKDTQSQSNRTPSSSILPKNIDPMSFFESDKGFVYIYKKTEKLATALYMITNLFGESEPMKWVLRKKVGDLLSFTINYKDISVVELTDFTHTMKTRVLEIVTFLEVCFRSGLVSSMNFSILKNEFSSLVTTLDEISKNPRSEVVHSTLPTSFFDVPQYEHTSLGVRTSSSEGIRNGHSSSNEEVKDIKNMSDRDIFKRTNRQNIILNLLKKKKELSIKDIAEVIRDCSEKTIQRELISLITTGVLKKTGERRWSKYSLVT